MAHSLFDIDLLSEPSSSQDEEPLKKKVALWAFFEEAKSVLCDEA
jgi:hypothetical protein